MSGQSYARIYTDLFGKFDHDKKIIGNFIANCPEGDILEVGAGGGRTLGFVEKRQHYALEADSEMFSILGERAKGLENVKLFFGKGPKLPFENGKFAGVFLAFGTAGETNPLCVLMQEISRVLLPGGMVFISVLNPKLYSTPPLGIQRTRQFSNPGYGVVSNTMSVPVFGRGEYQTHLWIRNMHFEHCFVVKQYFPHLEEWIFLAQQAGLELFSSIEELNNSALLNMVFKKSDSGRPVAKALEKIYDDVAPQYDSFVRNAEYGVKKWSIEMLDSLKGLNPKILDLACGNGLLGKILDELKIAPTSLIGYDFSREMVVAASQQKNYSYVCKYDLSGGLPGVAGLSVDCVTAFGLFEFLTEPSVLLKDIYRILVLGGEFFCTFEKSEDENNDKITEMNVKAETVLRRGYTKKTLENLLGSVGFKNAVIESNIGYRSPTTGQYVEYFFVRARKESL